MATNPLVANMGKQWGLITPQRISDGITNRQLSKILKEASADAEKLVASNLARMSVSGTVTAAQLKQATAGLQAISTDLWAQTGKITRAGMYQAGQAAADHALDLDLFMGMPGKGLLQYVDAIHFEASASIESLISRHTGGFALADRIYVHGKQTTAQVGRIIDKNLALQRSASDIAKEVRKHFDPGVAGGTSYAAMRLGRTEINNAHHETTKRLAKDRPWVRAMRWNLSSSHPKPDPCDAYASHNEGLGAGVWADPPSKPHPQCFCYLTHETEDPKVFMDNLVNGNYDDWLDSKGVSC